MVLEKHTTYFNMLEAFREKGCPFCRLADRSVYSYFDAFLFENVTDHEVSKKIRSAGGFCREHSRKFVDFNDSLAAAIVYESLIYDSLNDKKGSLSVKDGLCPACRIEEEAEGRYMQTFEEYLSDKEFLEGYEASEGVCMFHLKRLLPKLKKKEALAAVVKKESALLAVLSEELKEFMRKNDYRFSGEPWGKEKDSWRRAVGKFAGDSYMQEKKK